MTKPQAALAWIKRFIDSNRRRAPLWIISMILVIPTLIYFVRDCSPSPVARELNNGNWVGRWESKERDLEIREDGRLMIWQNYEHYRSKRGGKIRSMDDTTLFVDGVPWAFEVPIGGPPREEDGEWVLVVDGHVLRRQGSR